MKGLLGFSAKTSTLLLSAELPIIGIINGDKRITVDIMSLVQFNEIFFLVTLMLIVESSITKHIAKRLY